MKRRWPRVAVGRSRRSRSRRSRRPGTRRRAASGRRAPDLDGLASSFALPWRDLFKKKHHSEWAQSARRVNGEFAIDGPLEDADVPGRTTPLRVEQYRAFGVGELCTPLGYWLVNASAYHYLNADNQRAWSPDFTYVFGYDDWHPTRSAWSTPTTAAIAFRRHAAAAASAPSWRKAA